MRCRLLQWNREEVGNIFSKLEAIEVAITNLQDKEDRQGGLPDGELAELRGLIRIILLSRQEMLWR